MAQCLPACPSYSPPLAVFDLDKSASPPVVTLPTVKKAKKAKKPPGKKGYVTLFMFLSEPALFL